MVGTATVKYPCYYGIGNLVSWVWKKCRPFSAWWISSKNQAQTERQEDRHGGFLILSPSASEGSGNFLSLFFSVKFPSGLMYLTCVWQLWFWVEESCSMPRLCVFQQGLVYVCMVLHTQPYTHTHTHTVCRHTFVLVYGAVLSVLWIKQCNDLTYVPTCTYLQ